MVPPTDDAVAGTEPDADAIEFGRWLFAQDCGFVAGANTLDALPPDDLPEVAFAGRSNVGKSSLINALTGRNTLARTSQTPGRTQQINFFSLRDAIILVDLPGYGYAKASKSKISAWTELVSGYLRGRPSLRRLCLLIDARRGIKEADRELMTMLDEAAVSYQIVLTKIDKLTGAALRAVTEAARRDIAKHVAAHPEIMLTSAKDDAGIEALRAAIAPLADTTELGYSPAP